MINKRVILLGLLLCLSSCVVLAQTDSTLPQQPQTTSIQGLLDGIAGLKQSMGQVVADNNELRVQLTAKLDRQYQGLLLYCTILVVLVISVSRMLGRIYSWLMDRRWGRRSKRDMVLLHEKVDSSMSVFDARFNEAMSKMDSLLVQLVTVGGVLGSMNASVAGVPDEMLKLKEEVERIRVSTPVGASLFAPKPEPVVEKKGFWLFNLFKGKPKAEKEPAISGSADDFDSVAGLVERKPDVQTAKSVQATPMPAPLAPQLTPVSAPLSPPQPKVQEKPVSPASAEPSPSSSAVGGSASMEAFMEDWFNKKMGSMQQGSLSNAPVRRSAGRAPARKPVRKPVPDKTKPTKLEVSAPAEGLGVIEQAKNGRYFIKGHQGIVSDTKVNELLSTGKWKVVQRQ
jgi:hypothetical protein